MQKNTTKIWLGLILALAFILRLWGLGSDELLFDEGLYSFRSIGWLDYLESSYQTTPVQWLADSPMPWWPKLSFHDHPPLFFLSQHIFFKIFNDSLFASRLPSVLFGVTSVYLIYLIAKKLLASESAGLITSLMFAISFAAVSVSRLAMMESTLFFFILLNVYYFLKFLGDKRKWWKFGLSFGLAILTKYIAVFLAPAYLILLIKEKDRPSLKYILGAAGIALIIFSPVIIYNLLSYKTFGHFDLQISYLLHQKTPWPVDEFGGKTQDPFLKIGENITAVFSPVFLITAALGLAFIIWKKDFRKQLSLILLALLFTTLLLTQTGSAIRFTVLYVIPFAFLASVFFIAVNGQNSKIALILFILFMAHELFFTAERVFINKPNYGVAQLDHYLDSVLGTGRSEAVPQHPNPHLNAVIQKYAAKKPVTLEPTGIIYDDNLSIGPMLWLFSRRQYYHGLPVMAASQFQESLKNNLAMFNGLNLYFIKAEPAAPINPIRTTDYATQVEQLLISRNQKPIISITGSQNVPAFEVYKFSLK